MSDEKPGFTDQDVKDLQEQLSRPIEDGGPAFPPQYDNWHGAIERKHQGMSLRENYIGQALAGICANTNYVPNHSKINESFIRDIGRLAVAIADSALKARQLHD